MVTDLLAMCRRADIAVDVTTGVTLRRALLEVGLGERAFRAAALSVVAQRAADVEPLLRVFDQFFRIRAEPFGTTRLSEAERAALERAIDAEAEARQGAGSSQGGMSGGTGTLTEALLSSGFELQDRLEAAAEQVRLHEIRHAMQIGFFTQRMLEALGAEGIDGELDGLQRRLEADGVDGELIEAVRREAARLRPRVRAFVNDALERADPRRRERFRHERLVATPFVRLDRQEMAEVEEVVRRLGERLRGRLAIRRKRARRGGIDARATLRASYATLGVPVRILRRRRTIERPRLVLLVDVSESVRAVSRFFLQLVYALQEAFSGTRTFVFVGDVGEATALFRKHRVDDAIGRVLDGEAVLLASHSDYGTVFERFFRHHLSALTARSELLVLGDARSNRLDPRLDAFRGLTERAARTLWFNPEPRSSWGFGDSEMARFRPFVDEAFSVADVAALEKAVDALVRSRARSR